ncbi:TcaA NTF2-like domain-containing protein [Halobacillus litoralis]|uniref:TcaA NTF2-like domain-containing protein n=1 Tax=Halobacillus litoralis TaxID=45668 RepID=UPI001CFED35D|nr:hypothetical protein [Halobacillus litoralis]
MNYCRECGKPLQETQDYCIYCGAKAKPETQPSTRRTRPRPPLSRKTKTLIGVIVVLALFIFSFHKIMEARVDPLPAFKQMNQAVADGDAEAFFTAVTVDKEAVLNEDTYMDYLMESGWDDLYLQLVEKGKEESEESSFPITDSHGFEVFTMVKNSILGGLYHTYEVKANAVSVTAETTQLPIALEVGGESIQLQKEPKVENAFAAYPGDYPVKGRGTNDFGEFEYKGRVSIVPGGKEPFELTLSDFGETFAIQTNREEAVLFVNGKSTGKELRQYEELGPFPKDKDTVLYAEFTDEEGRVQRSGEVTSKDGEFGSLEFWFDTEEEVAFDVVEEEEEGLQTEELVLSFRDAYEQALNGGGYGEISPYLEDGSEAARDLMEYLSDVEGKGYTFVFHENNVLQSDFRNDTYVLTTEETFTFTDSNGEKLDYVRQKDYTLIESADGYKITKIDIRDTQKN